MVNEQSSILDFYPLGKVVYLAWRFFLVFFVLCCYLNWFLVGSCSYSVFGYVDFEVDNEGKRFMWQVCSLKSLLIICKIFVIRAVQYMLMEINVVCLIKGIVKLPFIEEKRLLAETGELKKGLSVRFSLISTIVHAYFQNFNFYVL